ncbi:peptidyl-prolyl cis-trans isomerase, cyclophilin-type [Niveomyces insectorum RCEF 264]|uniref:Peptidyl-prolyl cis-trans isomerase n=1 Tax=Niveomyces insectorum RCEF 264 TaxID=1081102 RepID=A0A162KB19_9HYPO|nr:peptidyl-prolyl cis-trans isomerase, cyclophilin-type [Niveomyces insectorum RCEF 264]
MSVTLHTNLGDLKIEVFCESVPKTAENFLALCASGYYDGSPFHRIVAGFMAQTGMPGPRAAHDSKDKGASIWGQPFADEIRLPALRHHTRGIVSMANRGAPPAGSGLAGTNASQFFVTFARAPHLDGVNTVFGRLLGDASFATLDKLEAVPVDKKYRPKQPAGGGGGDGGAGDGDGDGAEAAIPRIERVTIHANPLAK